MTNREKNLRAALAQVNRDLRTIRTKIEKLNWRQTELEIGILREKAVGIVGNCYHNTSQVRDNESKDALKHVHRVIYIRVIGTEGNDVVECERVSSWLYNGVYYDYGADTYSTEIEGFFPLKPFRQISRRSYEAYKRAHGKKSEGDIYTWSDTSGFDKVNKEHKDTAEKENAKKLAAK